VTMRSMGVIGFAVRISAAFSMLLAGPLRHNLLDIDPSGRRVP